MSIEACPECQRPYGRGEMARKRHAEIVRLRQEGKLLKEIALKVGVKHLSMVWWHLANRCRCGVKP